MLTGDGITEPVPCYFTTVKDQQQLDAAMVRAAARWDCAYLPEIDRRVFQPRLGQVVKLVSLPELAAAI